jgi:FixJ family two-component response regulator
MLSGNADIATESAAAGLGVSAFLRKPLKRRDLLDSVEAAIAAGIPA